MNENARALSALRPRTAKRCAVCDTPIVGVSTRRYCSNTCNQRAYRAARKGKGTPQ